MQTKSPISSCSRLINSLRRVSLQMKKNLMELMDIMKGQKDRHAGEGEGEELMKE